MKTIEQEIERIENLGGSVNQDHTVAIFRFTEPVSTNGGESITLKDALDIEGQMLGCGYEGALIGHPFDDSDVNCIHFQIH
jgi:hypothetical protein